MAGLEAVAEMPLLSLRLPLTELYSGLVFRPRPTLVDPPDNPASRFSIWAGPDVQSLG